MARLSSSAYDIFKTYLGTGKVDEITEEVRDGHRGKRDTEKWAEEIEEMKKNSRHRREIEPEEWRDFEDGWRPDDW